MDHFVPIDSEFAVFDNIYSYSATGCICICWPSAMWLTYEIESHDVYHFISVFFTYEGW